MIHWSYLDKLADLAHNGHNFVEVMIVHCRGSIPNEVGGRMFFAEDEVVWGTVGGGKIEASAIEKCKNLLSSNQDTEFVKWNLKKDIGMTCGGEISLFFQKFGTRSNFKIALFGAGHVSQSLCQFLAKLDVSVKCFDTRMEWVEKLIDAPNIEKICVKNLADEVKNLDEKTFILSITMGHKADLPILAECLKRNFPYVGAIGSQSKRNVLEAELLEAGVSKGQIDRLICPIGFPFGKNTPEEISLSILAQVLTIRDELNY